MDFDRIVLRRTAVALALFACGTMGSAFADNPPSGPEATTLADQKGSPGARAGQTPGTPLAAEQHRLPPDSTTRQTLELPGRTLEFAATAGSIRLLDDKGEPQADIAYTSYQLDGGDRATRPVTFFFNGGPGASSAWLQLGSAGPWRLPINADEVTPSTSPEVKPNAETWLDFTDLVFIDPVGTGYSRFAATGEDVRKQFFSVDGDVNALALVIRRWLEKHDRCCRQNMSRAKAMAVFAGQRWCASCRCSRASASRA
ncbi:carboxypeptidase C (cathepsin A) [Bradyrhizobium sp. LM6.10]